MREGARRWRSKAKVSLKHLVYLTKHRHGRFNSRSPITHRFLPPLGYYPGFKAAPIPGELRVKYQPLCTRMIQPKSTAALFTKTREREMPMYGHRVLRILARDLRMLMYIHRAHHLLVTAFTIIILVPWASVSCIYFAGLSLIRTLQTDPVSSGQTEESLSYPADHIQLIVGDSFR
ncbi:hypothetical protein KQX54_015717 [Cotesia glomerata]|uniref:Uncharacterized protein n=1 Tax=Cotesia glomerata TaxID=32391 RepID=A0AAV7IIC0_COTGL|nr:hypothetical protein KQX54_015717 [Cotesia glomerata]